MCASWYERYGPNYADNAWLKAGMRNGSYDPRRARVMACLCKGLTLDLGCGTCVYSHFFENVVCLDFSRVALKRARGRQRVCASAENLPFRDKYFNSIFSSQLLEHVDNDVTVLKEAHRVLAADGVIVVSVPNDPVWKARGGPHKRFYDSNSLRKVLEFFFADVTFHKYSHADALREGRLVASAVKRG